MKLAVIADIHANLAALETVVEHLDAWRPDVVVVAGDVVNRGPRPLECLRFVQQREQSKGWLTVCGNHEEYVIAQSRPDAPRAGPAFEIFQSSFWTYQQLGCDVGPLEAMPFQQTVPVKDGTEVRIVHASVRGTRDGIFPDTPDDVLSRQIGRPHVPLFCVGHTHWPLIRRLDGTLVVNVGAVGMPFDGDRRASYGQLTWRHGRWKAEIVRLPYDWMRAERDYVRTGFLDEGGPFARLMLVELQRAQSQLYGWTNRYEQAVLAGELSVQESVDRYLANPSQ